MDSDSVKTELLSNTVSATTIVDAPPAAVFDFLRRPANHPEISGDHTVKGVTTGPDAVSMGDKFGMKMHHGFPYRISSKVVEFEQDRRLAWCHIGGHRWRWEIEPYGEGQSQVTETFDMTTARFPPALRIMGYPKGHEKNVAGSVANVASHFAGRGGEQ